VAEQLERSFRLRANPSRWSFLGSGCPHDFLCVTHWLVWRHDTPSPAVLYPRRERLMWTHKHRHTFIISADLYMIYDIDGAYKSTHPLFPVFQWAPEHPSAIAPIFTRKLQGLVPWAWIDHPPKPKKALPWVSPTPTAPNTAPQRTSTCRCRGACFNSEDLFKFWIKMFNIV
jgi:hypothetical protein